MGNYEQLKQAVSDVIKTNGNQEITGAILQNALLSIISTIGTNATFAGIATPETNPGTPDQNVFYLASEPGVYANFGGVELLDQVLIFTNKNGNWVKQDSGIATNKKVSELDNKIDYLIGEENASDIGVNIFNKKSISLGWIQSNGIINEGQNFAHSNYINVEPNTSYIKNLNETNLYTAFYDSKFNFLGTSNQNPFVTPENTKYLRVSFSLNRADKLLVQKGKEIIYKSNVPYVTEKGLLVKINNNYVLKSERFFGYKNLLDPNGIIKDKYLSSTNGESSFSGFCISNYIPIKEGEALTAQIGSKSSFFQQCWEQYDEELNSIYRLGVNGNVTTTVGVKGCSFARISFRTQDLEDNEAQIEYGEEATKYEPYPTYKTLDERLTIAENNLSKISENVTDNDSINQLITNMFIVGIDKEKNYYIKKLEYTSIGYLVVEIYDEEETKVARVFANSLKIGGWWYIEPQNESEIWGFASTINFTEAKLIKGIKAKINNNKVTNEDGFIPTKLRIDFAEKDTTIRKNICNPINFYEKSEFKTVYADSFRTFLDFERKEGNLFNVYKQLIPLNIGESICVSYSQGVFQTKLILVNKYRVVLKPAVSASVSDKYIKITNDTEENGFVLFTIKHNDNKIGMYPQVEYSELPTDYQAYMNIPIIENDMPIVLPKKIYLSKGKEANIYKKAIILSNPLLDNIDINTNGEGESRTIGYPKLISFNTQNATTNIINLYAKKDLLVISKIEREFINVDINVGDLTILSLGDSFTDIANWIKALKEDLEEDGVNLSLIGMKNKTYKNESQTGGTLQNSFLISRGDAYLLSVNGFIETNNTTDGYGATKYKDSNNNQYTFNGRWVDENGDGYVRIAPISHENIPPQNSVLTKVGGIGLETINYSNVEIIDLNPIWDKETEALSVKKYIEKIGYSINGKFILIVQFSFNDNGRYYNTKTIQENIDSFKKLIELFHSEYPNAYIIIGIEPSTALIGGNRNYNNAVNYQRARMEFAKSIIYEFDNEIYDYVYINPGYAFVDTENGFSYTEIALSERFPNVLTKSVSDGTHCNEAGMFQLGDSYRAIVRHILSL